MRYHCVNIFNNGSTVDAIALGHGVSVTYRRAGDGHEHHENCGADSSHLAHRRESRGDSMAEINSDDTALRSVDAGSVVGFHVHAAHETRHADNARTGGVVEVECKEEVEAVEGNENVDEGKHQAGNVDEKISIV